LFSTLSVFTQSSVKFSGFIQPQFQYGEKDASLKVGTPNENPDEPYNRIGVRRGRIKLALDEGKLASGVFQAELTEKGFGLKEVSLVIKDPWINTLQVQAGIFNRPFGNEISYSSARLESPERTLLCQTLFPGEQDVGAMIVLQPAKSSKWNIVKLEAGFFAGNGIQQETDSRKDFIGQLSVAKTIVRNFSYGAGISYYNGGVFQGTEKVYRMNGKGFELNSGNSNKGKFAKREYIGFDLQLSYTSAWGISQLRTEYLFGQQPGSAVSSRSPNASVLPNTDTYIRNFNGAYAIFVQDLGSVPVSAVLKYEWYNPNTKVSGNEIGENNGTSKTDLFYNTLGLGALWHINDAVYLQVFYEINRNETSANIAYMDKDLKDNIFTLRLQYRF
jgi:hypothetical protein